MGNDHAGFELGGTPQQEESENEREEVHGNPTSKDMKRELVLELSCPSSYLMSFSFLSLPAWLSLAPRTMRFFFRQPQHESKHIPVRLAFHRRTVSCSYFDPSPIPTHPWLANDKCLPKLPWFRRISASGIKDVQEVPRRLCQGETWPQRHLMAAAEECTLLGDEVLWPSPFQNLEGGARRRLLQEQETDTAWSSFGHDDESAGICSTRVRRSPVGGHRRLRQVPQLLIEEAVVESPCVLHASELEEEEEEGGFPSSFPVAGRPRLDIIRSPQDLPYRSNCSSPAPLRSPSSSSAFSSVRVLPLPLPCCRISAFSRVRSVSSSYFPLAICLPWETIWDD
ncbi:hypothetical protein BHM03_00062331 [Ensete ventricosum]|nr:hypothetical protein BHM03_00062331 [Ensete ventricosum]